MIILSGGAVGADQAFGECGSLEKNITVLAMSFEGHNAIIPKYGKVIRIPEYRLEERKSEYNKVCSALGLNFSKNRSVRNLLLRNMFQVENKKFKSEFVLAFAKMEKRRGSRIPMGGTRYTIERAKMNKIPIVVLNIFNNLFYKYNYDKKIQAFEILEETIDISRYNIITGIGSREITDFAVSILKNTINEKIIRNEKKVSIL